MRHETRASEAGTPGRWPSTWEPTEHPSRPTTASRRRSMRPVRPPARTTSSSSRALCTLSPTRAARSKDPQETADMTTESTLLVVKPDGVRRGLIGEVIGRVEAKGLRIEQMRMMTVSRETAEEHYGEHREKPFFGELVDFITGGPVVVAKVTGESAIEACRALMGPTDPIAAAPGSIRGDYATRIGENIVHGSDSP